MSLEQLSRLQIYLVAYVAVALLVSLWVLPGLVAALTPIRARDMLGASRDSLITAFIAGDLFIVLPSLMQAAQQVLGRLRPGDDEPGRLTEVIVPASFNFPHTGKLLSLSFVLFAGWFADVPVPPSDYPAAGAHRAGHLFRQPHRGGAVSARPVPDSRRHLSAVSRDRRDQLARRLAGRGGAHADGGAARLLRGHRPSALAARIGAPLCRHHRRPGGAGPRRHAGALRVGPVAGILEGSGAGVDAPAPRTGRRPPSRALRLRRPRPASRRSRPSRRARCCGSATCPTRCRSRSSTSDGDLVGFDVELAHRLAREMDVTLAFVPVDRDHMAAQLADGLLRPRDVGRGDHHGPRARGAVLGVVSGRDRGVRRAGRPARTVCELGRASASRAR